MTEQGMQGYSHLCTFKYRERNLSSSSCHMDLFVAFHKYLLLMFALSLTSETFSSFSSHPFNLNNKFMSVYVHNGHLCGELISVSRLWTENAIAHMVNLRVIGLILQLCRAWVIPYPCYGCVNGFPNQRMILIHGWFTEYLIITLHPHWEERRPL